MVRMGRWVHFECHDLKSYACLDWRERRDMTRESFYLLLYFSQQTECQLTTLMNRKRNGKGRGYSTLARKGKGRKGPGREERRDRKARCRTHFGCHDSKAYITSLLYPGFRRELRKLRGNVVYLECLMNRKRSGEERTGIENQRTGKSRTVAGASCKLGTPTTNIVKKAHEKQGRWEAKRTRQREQKGKGEQRIGKKAKGTEKERTQDWQDKGALAMRPRIGTTPTLGICILGMHYKNPCQSGSRKCEIIDSEGREREHAHTYRNAYGHDCSCHTPT